MNFAQAYNGTLDKLGTKEQKDKVEILKMNEAAQQAVNIRIDTDWFNHPKTVEFKNSIVTEVNTKRKRLNERILQGSIAKEETHEMLYHIAVLESIIEKLIQQ
jgi:hypothetical protein